MHPITRTAFSCVEIRVRKVLMLQDRKLSPLTHYDRKVLVNLNGNAVVRSLLNIAQYPGWETWALINLSENEIQLVLRVLATKDGELDT